MHRSTRIKLTWDVMKRTRRGQLTLFIILGILLLFLIGFLIYAANNAIRERRTQAAIAEQIMQDILPVTQYADSCVELAANRAIELLGTQGGIIYSNQGGTQVESIKPHYNIKRISANQELSMNALNFLPSVYGFSSLADLTGKPHSMERQIISVVEKTFEASDNCLADTTFSPLFEERGYALEKSSSAKPKAQVSFGENDITVKLIIEWKVTHVQSGNSIVLKEFVATPKVRLKKIRKFANEIISNDNSRLDYDPATAQSQGMTVQVERLANRDSNIIITDSSSRLNGGNYQFIIARQNRHPLFVDGEREIPGCIDVCTSSVTDYTAIDPDEQVVSCKRCSTVEDCVTDGYLTACAP